MIRTTLSLAAAVQGQEITWPSPEWETSSLPPKWISEDGKTMWLVFSGDDSFSERRANVTTRD